MCGLQTVDAGLVESLKAGAMHGKDCEVVFGMLVQVTVQARAAGRGHDRPPHPASELIRPYSGGRFQASLHTL
jgi:hypothetical protein